jgi:phage terminase small subunit
VPLNEKQQAFVREYLIDLNATAAYQRAGYKARGHAAESAAARLLRNVEVQESIRVAQAQRAERTGITQDWVQQRLKTEAEEAESASARVSALRLLGLHLGLFEGAELLRQFAELQKQVDELSASASGGSAGGQARHAPPKEAAACP